MTNKTTVQITANFFANLDSIHLFLADGGAGISFKQIINNLLETVIPNLEQFPNMGIDFLARQAGSLEGVRKLEALKYYQQQGYSIREYIRGDYLILYAHKNPALYLLSIKHHKQLSFDFVSSWIE